MPQHHIRVFVSSPNDVTHERRLAVEVIEQLAYVSEFRGKVIGEPIAWDRSTSPTPFLATMTPQDAINEGLARPRECDIVVVILWSRMGTPLTEQYVKPDGSRYLSGTEWEYWDAFSSAKLSGKPLLLVYKRTEKVAVVFGDTEYEAKYAQWQMVQRFFDKFITPEGALIGGYNTYLNPDDFRNQFESHLHRLVNRLIIEASQREIEVSDKSLPVWSGSPFPGLRAFTVLDAPIFFGRGKETDALIRRVSQYRFVAVIGASGSGKSSLVGCGLLTRLGSNSIEGSKDWTIIRLTPGEEGDNPFLALASKIAPLIDVDVTRLADALLVYPQKIESVTMAVLRDKPVWSQLLIFVDQFEELFTTVYEKHLGPFIALLDSINQSQRTRCVVTMRSDFYHRCIDIPELAQLLREGSYPLAVPSQIALNDMITRPAERAALTFEDGLVETILKDIGDDPGSLALMAYALDELYKIRTIDGILTQESYKALGGVQGAIGKRAEAVFSNLDHETKNALGHVFKKLVEVDDRGIATRRRAPYSELTTSIEAIRLIEAFTDARLLVRDIQIVEVAHEALLRSWPRLFEWIGDVQEDLRLLKQVHLAAQEWALNDRRKDYLWSHERLQPVYQMMQRLQESPDQMIEQFIRPEHERLLDELKDSSTLDYRRQAIADRLAQIGVAAIPALIDTLDHNDKWVRAAGLRALIQLRERSIPALGKALKTSNEKVALRIARGMVAIGHTCVDVLVESLLYANPPGRYAAAYALDRFDNITSSAYLKLTEALRDQDNRVRQMVSGIVRRSINKEVLERAINIISLNYFIDGDPSVRANFAYMVGKARYIAAIDQIVSLLNDGEPEVRIEAILALQGLSPTSQINRLKKVVNESSSIAEKYVASYVLRKLGYIDYTKVMGKMLQDRSAQTRIAVVEAMGKIADRQMISVLKEISMRDTDSQVQLAALRSLDVIGRSVRIYL